jgi:hypothetical protein
VSVSNDLPDIDVPRVDPKEDLHEALGFCGCGCPEDAFAYVLGGLRLIHNPPPLPDPRDSGEEFRAAVDARFAAYAVHHGSDGAMYFFWYWCDAEGLTDHGSSVPGWLTEKGERLLAMLERWDANRESEEET